MELQEQITAYTAWVNSQLKKKSQHIVDFGNDLKDGTALITIVEIVSGHLIESVEPKTDAEKKKNVSKVIDFMKSNGIKIHHVTVDEIVTGNVKSTMQLILALAAHFKPASIGGRKDTTRSSSPRQSLLEKNPHGGLGNVTKELDFSKEMNEIQSLALELQQILLTDSDGRPLCGLNVEEELVIVRAEFSILLEEKQRQERELSKVRQNWKDVSTSNSALQSRLRQQEDDVLSLRQQLLHSNLARDKLKSEKAELIVELETSKSEVQETQKKLRDKDLKCQKQENDLITMQTEHIRAMTRKDREIKDLQRQLTCGSPLPDSVFHEPSFRLSPKRSPGLSRGSPTLSRRSPVSKNNPSRRRKVSENTQTRILYFTDRDMTPAMATISKRVGDITLAEFKSAIKKQGNFRYIFKALDPELGTVKEEVFHDDDIIPGWEGKIVAWVEEELHV